MSKSNVKPQEIPHKAFRKACVFAVLLLELLSTRTIPAQTDPSSNVREFAFSDAIAVPVFPFTFSKLASQPLSGFKHDKASALATSATLSQLEAISDDGVADVEVTSTLIANGNPIVSVTKGTVEYERDDRWIITDNAGIYQSFECSRLHTVDSDGRRSILEAKAVANDWCAPPLGVLALVRPQRLLVCSHCRLNKVKVQGGFVFVQMEFRPQNEYESTVFIKGMLLAMRHRSADMYKVIRVTLVNSTTEVTYIPRESHSAQKARERYLATWSRQKRAVARIDVSNMLPRSWLRIDGTDNGGRCE